MKKAWVLLFMVLIIPSTYAALSDGLVVQYTMDDVDTDGTTMVDKNGLYNGTLAGGIVTGETNCFHGGECYYFAGGDDRSDINDIDAHLPSDGSYTFMFWFKMNESLTSSSGLRHWMGSKKYRMSYDVPGWLNGGLIVGNYDGSVHFAGVAIDLPIGTEFMMAGTFNTTDNNLTFYMNGTKIDTGTGTYSGANEFTIGQHPVDGGAVVGWMDNVLVWNRTLTPEEVTEMWNGAEPLGVTINVPDFVTPTPADGDRNNTNVTINMTCGNADRLSFWMGTNNPPTSLILDNGTTFSFTTNFSVDDTYYYQGNCYNTTTGESSDNTSARSWVLDTTIPTITLNAANGFNTTNMSLDVQYLTALNLDITFADNNELFLALINITKDGVMFFNYSNSSMEADQTSFNYVNTINTSSWLEGIYQINITVADSHTASKIEDYDVFKTSSRIRFDTDEGIRIEIEDVEAISTSTNKKMDRYDFGFNYTVEKKTRTYILESDHRIVYKPSSKYKGHFIIWNPNTQSGNWVDFEGLDGDYFVTKISDYTYTINFVNIPSKKNVVFESVGSLNTDQIQYSWYKGNYTEIFTASVAETFPQTFFINVSRNTTYISDVSATFFYNESPISATKTTFDVDFQFSADVTIPDVTGSGSFLFWWELTIEQENGSTYSFNTTAVNQSVLENSLLVNVFHQDDLNGLPNVTIFLNGVNQTENITLTNNTWNLNSINVGEYTVKVTKDSFEDSHYFITIEDNVTNGLNAYMMPTANNTDVLVTITDGDDDAVVNSEISLQRFYPTKNAFLVVDQYNSDTNGQFLGHVRLEDTEYIFLIKNSANTILRVTERSFIYSTSLNLRTIQSSSLTTYNEIRSIQSNISYDNSSSQFTFFFSDTNNIVREGCLAVDQLKPGGNVQICNNCASGTSATITCTVTDKTGQYLARGYINTVESSPSYTHMINSMIHNFDNAFKTFGNMGLLISFIMVGTLGLLAVINPAVSVFAALLGLIFSVIIGIVYLSYLQIIVIIIIGFYFIVRMRT
tara:strand:+ start:2867 stop:5935 length:3069 start_codon:yes stop_codon:yes gene_type:complete